MRGVMTFQIPEELFAAFVQWVRDFDTKHQGCEINIFGESKVNAEAIRKIFQGIKPDGFPFVAEWKLKE